MKYIEIGSTFQWKVGQPGPTASAFIKFTIRKEVGRWLDG